MVSRNLSLKNRGCRIKFTHQLQMTFPTVGSGAARALPGLAVGGRRAGGHPASCTALRQLSAPVSSSVRCLWWLSGSLWAGLSLLLGTVLLEIFVCFLLEQFSAISSVIWWLAEGSSELQRLSAGTASEGAYEQEIGVDFLRSWGHVWRVKSTWEETTCRQLSARTNWNEGSVGKLLNLIGNVVLLNVRWKVLCFCAWIGACIYGVPAGFPLTSSSHSHLETPGRQWSNVSFFKHFWQS